VLYCGGIERNPGDQPERMNQPESELESNIETANFTVGIVVSIVCLLLEYTVEWVICDLI
jgi:hypothetical protein